MGEIQVLIADDSEMLRTALRGLLLSQAGKWRVCGEACDGQDTLQKVSELNPDVLLLDLSIPVVRGPEVVRALKESAPALHIILMSEQEGSVMELLARDLGLRYAIPKSRLTLDLIPQLTALCLEIKHTRDTAGAEGSPAKN